MMFLQHSMMVQQLRQLHGVGTYTVAPDGTVTFVPEKSFVRNSTSSDCCS
ncbi:MAG: hypothetical protein ACLTYH_10090 [Streptococcus salivarius]